VCQGSIWTYPHPSGGRIGIYFDKGAQEFRFVDGVGGGKIVGAKRLDDAEALMFKVFWPPELEQSAQ